MSKFKAGLLTFAVVLAFSSAYAQPVVVNQQASAISPITQPVETGPVLDVVPYVLSDGYTINLTLIPSDTEFENYDSAPILPNVTGNLNVVELPIVLPRFSVKEVVTTVNVWDNQTVVLGGLISSTISTVKNKVPVLGDLPLVGVLFQNQSKSTAKRNLMIFVTTSIVDPAGNRVHSDDELPFTQNSTPPQDPENSVISERVRTVRGLPDSSNN